MQVQVVAQSAPNITTDVLVVGLIGRGTRSAGWKTLTAILGGNPEPALALCGWKGQVGELITMPAPRGSKARLLAVSTLAERGGVEDEVVRQLAQRVAVLARKVGLSRAAFVLDHATSARAGAQESTFQSIGAGLAHGGYVFESHLPKKSAPPLTEVVIGWPGRRDREEKVAAVARGLLIGAAQNRARDLVNEPANVVNPSSYVGIAQQVASASGLDLIVLDEEACRARGMGAFLAVGQGGGYPSNLIHLAYRPTEARARVVLIGKAVTFDSGGLCIKTAEGQALMKMDMGGSAAVLGAIEAVAALALPVEVHAIFAACENMTGSKAFHTGDVLKASNGKTIEVINTDAEGRLTLADALVYGAELKPDYIVDVATLTGACMVALGMNIGGIMGNSRTLVRGLKAAGDRVGEPMWELPLPEEYKELIKSKIADLKNLGGRWGGAITAGLFLQEFVPDSVPWAHIDIAGPCFVESPTASRPFGATGYPVRALVDWIRTL